MLLQLRYDATLRESMLCARGVKLTREYSLHGANKLIATQHCRLSSTRTKVHAHLRNPYALPVEVVVDAKSTHHKNHCQADRDTVEPTL